MNIPKLSLYLERSGRREEHDVALVRRYPKLRLDLLHQQNVTNKESRLHGARWNVVEREELGQRKRHRDARGRDARGEGDRQRVVLRVDGVRPTGWGGVGRVWACECLVRRWCVMVGVSYG